MPFHVYLFVGRGSSFCTLISNFQAWRIEYYSPLVNRQQRLPFSSFYLFFFNYQHWVMTPSKIASYEFLNFHLLRNNPVWSIPRMSLSLHVPFVVHVHWMWILACFITASVYRVLTNHVLDCSVTMACDHYKLPSGCRPRYNLFFCSHFLWIFFFFFFPVLWAPHENGIVVSISLLYST